MTSATILTSSTSHACHGLMATDGEQLQVVPNVASPPLEGDREKEPASYQRKLPEIVQDAKPLDLFDGSAGEIFAGREE